MNRSLTCILCVLIFVVSGNVAADDHSVQVVFEDRVFEIEQQAGGRIGVAILDTGTEELLEYRSGERFAMCSTFKLPLVAAILNTADSNPDLMNQMILFDSTDILA